MADDTVSVCVSDSGVGFERPQQSGPRLSRQPGGFGLMLLDQLSRRGGIERDERRFRVWFRLSGEAPR